MKAEILTYKLNNGREVIAKEYKGDTYPKTFANLTQANNAAAKLGAGWYVIGHCPFYVTYGSQSGNTATDVLLVVLALVAIGAVFTLGALPALIAFTQLATMLKF